MEPLTLSRAVRDAFRDILGNPSLSGRDLTTTLESAGSRHGVEPFRTCLQVLSAAPRDEADARRTLDAIEAHRDDLRKHLVRDPGLAVAAADYLQVMEGQAWRTSLRLSRLAQATDPRERALDDIVAAELRRSERLGRPLSLLLLAPDRGGLDEPEARAAGAALKEAVRGVDRVVRLLPAGFALVMPCTTGGDAVRAAARLRVVVGRATDLAWSAGIASVPGVRPVPEALAASARAGLRLARCGGGGAVCPGQGDRRRTRRRMVDPHLAASMSAGGRDLRAGLRELSPSGALLHLGEGVRPGTRVRLTVRETTPRARSVTVLGSVLRSDPAFAQPAGDHWRVALSFDRSADSLRRVADLIAALPAPVPETGRE